MCTVGGNVNSTATMENRMEVLQKLNIELPYDAVILLLEFMFEKNHCLEGYLYPHVHCSIIQIAKTWK